MVYRHILILAGLTVLLALASTAGRVNLVPIAIADSELHRSVGIPLWLKIPKISVDAVVEPVGITADGLMDSPKNPAPAGWFSLGERPGEIGSAVIDGHSGWKDNIPAVFDNLYKLRTGDKIFVEDEKGIIVTFVVREIKTYDPKTNASEVFDSSDGKAHLNLITCEGIWDPVSKSSSKRLVVFTDKLI